MLQAEVLPVYDTLGGDFEMDSTLGKTVSLRDFEGKLLLIYFGYTSCQDVCPTTLTVIKQAVQKLDPKNRKHLQEVITLHNRNTVSEMNIHW